MRGLSAEALREIQGLNLEEVKKDLSFTPVEGKKRLTVDLDWMEQASIPRLDFSSVLEKLNALGTKPAHEEKVVLPKTEEDALKDFWEGIERTRQQLPQADDEVPPSWLTPPAASEEELRAPSAPVWKEEPEREEPIDPHQAWSELPEDQRGRDLKRWKLKAYLKEPLEDWQKEEIAGQEAAIEEEPVVAEEEEPVGAEIVVSPKKEKLVSVEGMKLALEKYLSTWLNRNKLAFAAELTGGTTVGFLANLCFTELIAHDPQMAKLLPTVLTTMLAMGVNLSSAIEGAAIMSVGIRKKYELANKYAKTSSFAERVAVVRSANNMVDRILLGTASEFRLLRDLAIRPGTTGFVAGAWLYAALSGAGVFGESGLTHQAHAVSPADSGGAGAGAGAGQEQTGGHSAQPDMESLRARGQIDTTIPPVDQPPADQPPPTADWTRAGEQLKAEEQIQAEAAKQAVAEAARIAALNQGQTVLEIATTMPQQTVSEAILKIIGDIPHGGEITNVIYRAAGEDVGKLHEGAIRELANTLSDLFSKADTAANNLGVPYGKGVLNVVNNTQSLGPNSSVANIIRAGNLGDMEAAAKIREEVFKPILQVLAK